MARPCSILYSTLILVLLAPVSTSLVSAGNDLAVRERLQARIDQIQSGGECRIGGSTVVTTLVVPEFYIQREFRPAWDDPGRVEFLIAAIRDSYRDGLRPKDYHLEDIEQLLSVVAAQATPDPGQLADLDILQTDALLLLAYHHLYGKVDPESVNSNWNIERDILDRDPVTGLERALTQGTLAADLEAIKPRHPFYERLRSALAEHRRIESEGGWGTVSDGPTIRSGDEGPRIPALRSRLRSTGDLAMTVNGLTTVFDEQLAEAVKRFQARHGLTPDGVVGRNTLAELNVPVETRIATIRINLERARWYSREVGSEAVFANIAGFNVYFVRNQRVEWNTRSMVGQLYRKTPLFRGEMAYIQFNPTWTVPPTILRKDILPKVRKDPSYLTARNISVLDRQGNRVDPDGVDWPSMTGRNFPYILRQEPGPNNVLGRVKFIFPNPHFVFLHDTPNQGGFDKETRAFSSGCIRVENPLKLAELMLDDPERWSAEKIQQVVDSRKTETVHLKEPTAVYLAYWTAAGDDDGVYQFRRDVYDRDSAVLAGLDSDFPFAGSVKRPFESQMGK